MDLDEVRRLCESGAVEFTRHISKRLLERGIMQRDVLLAIMNGCVIEDYATDKPFPSCLIAGANGLHVVCSIGLGRLWLITVYRPDGRKWEEDLRTRKRE